MRKSTAEKNWELKWKQIHLVQITLISNENNAETYPIDTGVEDKLETELWDTRDIQFYRWKQKISINQLN